MLTDVNTRERNQQLAGEPSQQPRMERSDVREQALAYNRYMMRG